MRLYEVLREETARHPNQLLRGGNEAIPVRELFAQAEALGRTLTEAKYGILCEAGLNGARALLACLYAGKTAVPLSLRYGEKHIGKIIGLTGLTHLLRDDGVSREGEPCPEEEELGDVALILCTSGTTGAPKGAMLTEDGLLANLRDIRRYFAIGEEDRLLIARPLYHCAVLVGEFLLSLLTGTEIVFDDGEFNPARILERVREDRITVMGGTPTLFYHMAGMIRPKSEPVPLKTLAISGECMTPAAAAKIRSGFPTARIYHVYGLTEAGPRVSYLPPEEFDAHPNSVGIPLESVEADVRDGELLVRSPAMMKGYYRNPELTEQVLRDGWLHTGDMAARDERGFFIIKGRRDDLIIRAGMNIYPQEIENALQADERIREALAYGGKGTVGQHLHLTVVPEGALKKSEVLSICRERLPSYQIPDEVELAESLPRNGSGKLLRPRGTAEPPPFEKEVRELVAKALELPSTEGIEVGEDLEASGLDSLNFITLVILCEERFGVEVPMEKLGLSYIRSIRDVCQLVKELTEQGQE